MALSQGYSSTTKVTNDTSYTTMDSGPYVAIVKVNEDTTRMGRIGVVIPAIHGADNVTTEQLISCEYLSPFYGAKSASTVNPSDVTNFANSQHAYGMWMTPPDIDTKVLVTFAEGKITQGYWIGCIQEPFANNMVPGLASSENVYERVEANELGGESVQIQQDYGQKYVPVGETNRGIFDEARVAGFDKLKKPIHPFADVLKDQGLSQDNVRGNTSSSARRESPSNVFGISTPGPIDNRSTKFDNIGPTDSNQSRRTVRKGGHTFVMDDGDSKGDNQLVRLRTSSGHQLVMNDSAGVVYLANSEGTVWMEFSNNGMVDVYAQTGYNLRSGADINFHAEGNINMYANKNIKIKANENFETKNGVQVPLGGVSIDGATVKAISTLDMRFQAQNIYEKAFGKIVADAGTQNIQQGKGQVHLVGGQVHFNSAGVGNYVPSMFRTNFLQPSGTGTASTNYPDVTLKPKGQLYEVDRALPGMSGMRIPTHEPFWGHQDVVPTFGSVGGTDVNIGTAGWIESQNRNADLMSIKWAQYQADLEKELATNTSDAIGSVTSLFNAGYAGKYGVSRSFFTDGVTGYSALSSGAYETYNNIVSGIGTNAKDAVTNVLINESGVLYTSGTNQIIQTSGVDKVTGKLNQTITRANNVGTLLSDSGLQQGVATNVAGLQKANNIANNVTKVTETYKNVVGGKVTSVVQTATAVSNTISTGVKIARVARSVGKFFGF